MKLTPEYSSQLTEKILQLETKLELLEKEILEIGQPAGQELQRRLNVLKIEEGALRRNFEESVRNGEPDSVRLAKIEQLLHHIEREETAVERDADFLHQAAPSSMTLAVEAGAKMVDLYRRGVKKVIGDHHPLGESVFVNHSHESLKRDYGIKPSGSETRDNEPA